VVNLPKTVLYNDLIHPLLFWEIPKKRTSRLSTIGACGFYGLWLQKGRSESGPAAVKVGQGACAACVLVSEWSAMTTTEIAHRLTATHL
jgi:hypothetical protein